MEFDRFRFCGNGVDDCASRKIDLPATPSVSAQQVLDKHSDLFAAGSLFPGSNAKGPLGVSRIQLARQALRLSHLATMHDKASGYQHRNTSPRVWFQLARLKCTYAFRGVHGLKDDAWIGDGHQNQAAAGF
jgi:hypothetical protein